RCVNGLAQRPAVIHPEVSARELPIEHTASTKAARHSRFTGTKEPKSPQRWRLLRAFADVSSEFVLALNALCCLGVQWLSEARVHAEACAAPRWRRRFMRNVDPDVQAVSRPRRAYDHRARNQRVSPVNRNGAECLKASVAGRHEPERLARHLACCRS